MSRRRTGVWGGRAVDAAALLTALALAMTPLLPAFGGWTAVPAGLGGLLLGGAVAAVGTWRSWRPLPVVAGVVVVYLVAGGWLAVPDTLRSGLIPTASTFTWLAVAPVTAWKEMLTLDPPLGSAGYLLAVPYLMGLIGAAAAISIAWRASTPRRGAPAAALPVLLLALATLLGTAETVAPVPVGVALVLICLTWAGWRTGGLQPRRVIACAAMAAVVVAGGAVGGPALTTSPRFVLRDRIVPPFDETDYPSPLSAFRSYVKENKDTTLFTVQGKLPEGTAVRLAVMDAYDGVVWNVAGSDASAGSGAFRRVGASVTPTQAGTSTEVRITLESLTGVWLPTVGQLEDVTFSGDGAAEDREEFRYNDATGGAVITGGLRSGDSYRMDVVVPTVPDAETLARAQVRRVALPSINTEGLDQLSTRATEVAGSATSPGLIAQALATFLSENGYFSHGLTDQGEHATMSGHGANRMNELLGSDLMIGDGEQYASAMALMARQMGLPARVVLGFVPKSDAEADGTLAVTGNDIQAWVEIDYEQWGWVAYWPTPPENRRPIESTENRRTDPDPRRRQPPVPPQEPVTPPEDDVERPNVEPDPEPVQDTTWRTVVVVAASVGIPLILVSLPVVGVLALKARRRRRRKGAPDTLTRVVGGWDEVMDAALDLRRAPSNLSTRREKAMELGHLFAGQDEDARARGRPTVGQITMVLAREADAAVFDTGEPTPAAAVAYWDQVETALRDMHRSRGRLGRWRARLSVASLRARRRARRERRG